MSTQAVAHPGISPRRPLKLAGVLIVTAAAVALFALMLIASLLGAGAVSLGSAPDSFGVSALAESEIPPLYLSLYEQAARRYGLDWAILAGIGKVECDHGRDPDPSCTKEGEVNSAGAGGPAQFLGFHVVRVRSGRRRQGLAGQVGPGRCYLRNGELFACLGCPAELPQSNLCLQPRVVVCE